MSFCPKCGSTIPEGSTEKFCSTCGQPIEGNVAPETKNESSINTDEVIEKGKEIVEDVAEKGKTIANDVVEKVKSVDVNEVVNDAKAGNKKAIGIIAGVVAVVVLVVIIIANVFGGGSYMDPINDYIKAINKQETDYYTFAEALKGSKITKAQKKEVNALIDSGYEVYGDSYEDYWEDYLEEYSDGLEDIYDEVSDEYDDWKLSFETKNAEKLDSDDLEDYADDINDYYEEEVEYYEDLLDDEDELEDFADLLDMDEDDVEKMIKAELDYYKNFVGCKVSAGYEIKGKFIVNADGDEYETEYVKLVVLKINGDWVYCGTEDYISIDTDGDDEAYVLNYLLNKFSRGLYF